MYRLRLHAVLLQRNTMFENVANMQSVIRDAKSIIDFYGGADETARVAAAVRKEQSIFLRAVDGVRAAGSAVYPNVTLLECAKIFDASGNLMRALSSKHSLHSLAGSRNVFIFTDDLGRDAYTSALYAEYVRLGGNHRIVVYGLPEYALMVAGCAFTSTVFTDLCSLFVDPMNPLSAIIRDHSPAYKPPAICLK